MMSALAWFMTISSLTFMSGSLCIGDRTITTSAPHAANARFLPSASRQARPAIPDAQASSPAPKMTATQQPAVDETEIQLLEKRSSAPDIEGAEKRVADIDSVRRIVYTALPDNPYGLAAGLLLGEYKHEVYLGDQRTGGIALAAPVAQRYLQKALDALPAQQERWLLTLPVDLTDCRSLRPVRIDLSAKPLIDRPYYIRISAEKEQLGVVNILNDQQQVVIDEFKMFGLHYIISQRSNKSLGIIAGEEMAFLFVIVRFQELPRTDVTYSFGDRLGTTQEPVLAGLTSVRGPFRKHTYDCILKIDGCPVFLMANRKK
jgi:hypothetical protein